MIENNLVDKTQRTLYKKKLLHKILIVCIVISASIALINLVGIGDSPLMILFDISGLIVVSIVGIILNHFNHTKIAAGLTITAVFLTVGLNMLASRAVTDPAIIVLPGVILGGCLYLGRKSIIAMIIGAVLMITAIGLAEIYGLYQADQPVTLSLLIVYLVLILGTSLFVRVIVIMNENYLDELELKQEFIEAQKKELQQQLDEKTILMSELHHRVKNNLMIITSVLDSKMDFLDSQDSKGIFEDSIQRIQAISSIHEKLYESRNLIDVNMNDYIQDLIDSYKHSLVRDKNIKYLLYIDKIKINMNKAIPLAMLINELLTNSFKHAFNQKKQGEILISLQRGEGDHVEFIYEDNGSGFDSSQISQKSIGSVLIPALAEQLHAKMKTDFQGKTRYELIFHIFNF
ncbi:MAG: sensor histidine kinase [Spirochaetales bacterium]|nr:sensor histidine kinase [Spirochaetales bacterium]